MFWGEDLLGSVLEPVAVALKDDDLGVMHEAVDHGCDRDGVAEDFRPGGERLVRAHDQAGSFVASRDHREKQRGGVGVEGDVADLVDDDERNAAESFEFFFEPAGASRFAESADPVLGRRERDAVAASRGVNAERDRQVRLAGPGRTKKITFFASARKSSCARCAIVCCLTERWKVKSKSSRVLTCGNRAALPSADRRGFPGRSPLRRAPPHELIDVRNQLAALRDKMKRVASSRASVAEQSASLIDLQTKAETARTAAQAAITHHDAVVKGAGQAGQALDSARAALAELRNRTAKRSDAEVAVALAANARDVAETADTTGAAELAEVDSVPQSVSCRGDVDI